MNRGNVLAMERRDRIGSIGPFSPDEAERIYEDLSNDRRERLGDICRRAMIEGWTGRELGNELGELFEGHWEYLREQAPHDHDDDERHS
jgi:hypothetical protein